MYQKLKNKIYILLRKSEKWTKTDMIYLASGGFWLTAGQVVSAAASFLLAIAFANLLPKETFGIYKYVLSIAGLLSIPTLAGINTALIRSVARGYEGSLSLALKTKIKWGFLGGLASLFLAGYYFLNDNHTLTFGFLITAIFIPFFDSLLVYNSFLNGKKLFKFSSKCNAYAQILSVLSIFLTLLFTKNVLVIVSVYFLSNLLLRTLILIISIKKFKPNKEKEEDLIKYGFHLSFINALGSIANQIDKILVFHYLGAIELAVYSFSIIPVEQIKAMLKNISALAFPKFSAKNMKEIKINFYNKLFKLSLVITLIIFIYIISAPFLFKIFFPEYLNSIFYSQLFSLSLYAIPVFIITSIFESQKLTSLIYKFKTITSIIQIILIFIGVYWFGLIGIIIARIINRFINFLIGIIYLKKEI